MSHRVSRRELVRGLAAPAHRRARAAITTAPAPIPLPIPFGDHLLSRATFGRNAAATAELQQMGLDGWLHWQLDPQRIDDSAIEAALPTIVDAWASNGPDVRMLARAIYSRRQLAWRMTYFLNNHFSTYRLSTQPISESNEDDTFYKSCFSDFRTVLRFSATSPAMIDFLDSRSNIAGSPNENYARELMELHTLGVNGGYTETDVAQAARVFTGWSRVNTRTTSTGPIDGSRFQFLANRHDTGAKSLSLGWSTPGISGSNGWLEGMSLLDFLAAHPNTATYFTGKLCRYFVADVPPAGLLQRVRQAFVQSAGSLKATLLALFYDPEFASPAVQRDKVHDGFEYVANAVRRFEIPNANTRTLGNEIAALQSLPHSHPEPTGYDETGPEWQGSGNVLPRWAFANDLVTDRLSGVRVPWTTLYGTNRPTGGAAWVDELLQRLVDGDVPATTRTALTVFMNQRLAALPSNPTLTQVLPHVRDLASMILRLPEAQLC